MLSQKSIQKILAQGAEAKIILDETKKQIIKDRISKSYRLKELDDKIRRLRTRSEAKLLIKASQIINVPLPLIDTPFKGGRVGTPENTKLIMPFIEGKKLSEHLDSFSLEKQKQIMKQIGKDIAKLHDADIIHGDLTTSNMIYVEDNPNVNNPATIDFKSSSVNTSISGGWASDFAKDKSDLSIAERDHELGISNKNNFKLFFIDFGLGFSNGKIEDKAVDIHLLKQALEAKHFKNWKKLFNSFLEGYKNSLNYEKTLNQLTRVEKRGRYKNKD